MAGQIGIGTTLSVGTGSEAALIGNVRSIKGAPRATVTSLDVTSMDNTDGYKSYIPGLVDPGTVDIELVATDQAISQLNDLVAVEDSFEVEWVGGATFTFSGFLREISNDTTTEKEQVVTASFQVSGKPTYTPAAS